jgi:hypothetical protein
MEVFDLASAGAARRRTEPSSVNHSTVVYKRARPRSGLGAAGTALVLMGIGMGVLTIRFIIVFAHTVLQ